MVTRVVMTFVVLLNLALGLQEFLVYSFAVRPIGFVVNHQGVHHTTTLMDDKIMSNGLGMIQHILNPMFIRITVKIG